MEGGRDRWREGGIDGGRVGGSEGKDGGGREGGEEGGRKGHLCTFPHSIQMIYYFAPSNPPPPPSLSLTASNVLTSFLEDFLIEVIEVSLHGSPSVHLDGSCLFHGFHGVDTDRPQRGGRQVLGEEGARETQSEARMHAHTHTYTHTH